MVYLWSLFSFGFEGVSDHTPLGALCRQLNELVVDFVLNECSRT